MKLPSVMFDDEDLRIITEYGKNFVEIRRDFILLEVNELDTVFQKENFEIELFEIETDTEGSTSTEVLIPLKFDGPRLGSSQGDPVINYVDYFFNIGTDMEIDEQVLCKYKGVDTAKGIFLQRTFECAIDDDHAPADQYRTDISDIGEMCD